MAKFNIWWNEEQANDQDLYSTVQGVILHWASTKKLKYGKPRLGESTLT